MSFLRNSHPFPGNSVPRKYLQHRREFMHQDGPAATELHTQLTPCQKTTIKLPPDPDVVARKERAKRMTEQGVLGQQAASGKKSLKKDEKSGLKEEVILDHDDELLWNVKGILNLNYRSSFDHSSANLPQQKMLKRKMLTTTVIIINSFTKKSQ